MEVCEVRTEVLGYWQGGREDGNYWSYFTLSGYLLGHQYEY